MKKLLSKALAVGLAPVLTLGFSGISTFAAGTDGALDSVGATNPNYLEIVEGSNGTLLTSDEQLATITLKNVGTYAITVTEYNLGTYEDHIVMPDESLTISAPDIYADPNDADGDGDLEAYKLALVVDGVEQPVEAGGAANGDNITVAIVKGVLDYYASHGQTTPRYITCALYADENGVDPAYSVLPMVTDRESGTADVVGQGAKSVSNAAILSTADLTAGIRVGGTGEFSADEVYISLYGDGGDDFTGIGSALGVADTATLNVKSSSVYTEGIIRSAIFAGDDSSMNIADTVISCDPGEYQSSVSIASAGMASPPNGLGIWGNCRAMNMVDSADVTIEGCDISSQNWGALGVDDITDGTLTVRDSEITIKEQGYGAYSIGKCLDYFDNCKFNIAYGVVGYAAAGSGSEIWLVNGTEANSLGYYGVVTHQSFNGTNSTIVVDGQGTSLNGKYGGIIAKGRGADITISDQAVVTATDGPIIRAQINDDTGAGSMDGTEVVNVAITSTTLSGDIIQGMGTEGSSTETSTMNVVMASSTLTGDISSAKLTLKISDGNISFDNITDVGIVTNTEKTDNSAALLNVTLTSGSTWNVVSDSYVDTLTVDSSSKINGYATMDGKLISLVAGKTYSGNIIVHAGTAPADIEVYDEVIDGSDQDAEDQGSVSASTKASISANKTSLSYKALKKKAQKVKITATTDGKITSAKCTSKKLSKNVSIKANGKQATVTFKKGSSKGNYKIKVTTSASGDYVKTTKTLTIKVK